MTLTNAPVVRLQRTVPASPNLVYRAWLEPERIRQWLAPGSLEVTRAEVDDQVGGRYRIWQGNADGEQGGFECEILELVPDRRIVFSWGFVGPERAALSMDSQLTITLEDAPEGATTLTLVHEHLDALHDAMPEVAEMVETGWKLVLDKLGDATR
jgi:uncharacterized protein YndB with AHSA1/START domain